VPYRRIGDEFFEIKSDGTLSDKPASASITFELLKKLGGESSDVVEEVTTSLSEGEDNNQDDFDIEEEAAAQFRNRDDLLTGEEFPGRPVAKAKKEDSAVTQTKSTPIQLAMKYLDGTISDPEKTELSKALRGDGGDELAKAIKRLIERRRAEKEVSAYTDTTIRGSDTVDKDKLSETQVKALRQRVGKQRIARGGLMGR
jgi:hypothetical protein